MYKKPCSDHYSLNEKILDQKSDTKIHYTFTCDDLSQVDVYDTLSSMFWKSLLPTSCCVVFWEKIDFDTSLNNCKNADRFIFSEICHFFVKLLNQRLHLGQERWFIFISQVCFRQTKVTSFIRNVLIYSKKWQQFLNKGSCKQSNSFHQTFSCSFRLLHYTCFQLEFDSVNTSSNVFDNLIKRLKWVGRFVQYVWWNVYTFKLKKETSAQVELEVSLLKEFVLTHQKVDYWFFALNTQLINQIYYGYWDK